mgnify:CR=1 FL=1
MFGARYGWHLRGRWYPGFGPGWGWGRGWGFGPGLGLRTFYPRFAPPRGWCWWALFNEKEYLQAEKEAIEKYLEEIKGRLEEMEKESNQEKQL